MTHFAKILIIDNQITSQHQLAQLLFERGYQIEIIDEVDGIELPEAADLDLILVSADLSPQNGYEVAAALKAEEAFRPLPLLLLSDVAGNIDRARVFAVGGADYLLQPFQPEEVWARLDHHLGQRQLEQALQRANQAVEQRVTERTSALSQTVSLLEEQVQERKRAEMALQQYADLLGVLHRIDQAILAAQSPEAIGQAVLEYIRTLVFCEQARMTLFDFEQQKAVLLAINQNGNTQTGAQETFPLDNFGDIETLRQGQPLVDDLSAGPLSPLDKRLLAEGLHSRIHAPLVSREKLIGCLTLAATQPGVFSVEHAAIAHEVATQLAVALENARLYTEAQAWAKQLTALNKANRAMASTLNLDIVLEQVMREVKTLLNAEGASVLLHDADSDELIFSTVVAPDAEALTGMRLPLSEGIAGWVMQERKPVLIGNVQDDPRFYDRIDDVSGLTTQSLLAVPLISKAGVIGVVEVINKAGQSFNQQDLDLLEALTGSAAIAIENARLYQDLQDRMKALQETQTQLIQSEKVAALGRLMASITHEINNPLQSVQTCLTLTKEEMSGERREEKIERYLDIVESEIQRVSTIVRRMRDFYRPAANQGLQWVNLRTLLESVLALTGKQLQHSRIVIEGVWSKTLPKVQVNPDHIKQVFLNLILNAIDAMPEGGTLTIATQMAELPIKEHQPPVPAACLEFRDSGEGMSEETLAHLFEPFFTTKPEGSGLGLCISYNIIEAHHGQITVVSQEGKGTTFSILLPVTQLAEPVREV